MAIIYSFPNLPLNELSSNDTLVINDTNANDEIVTKTVSLSNLATYITNTGTGTGTTNTLTLWSDGPNGLLGDSILTQDSGATAITVAGNLISTGTGNFTGQVTIPTTPAAATDAASKNYVDTEIAGIPAGLVFKGNWNASTNNPALASGTGTVGNYYVVSVAGNTDLDGITDWQVGDWAVFVEVGGVDKWDKIDQTFVSGSGAAGQVTFWNTINTVSGDNDFYWDNVNKRLGIGNTTPLSALGFSGGPASQIGWDGANNTRAFIGYSRSGNLTRLSFGTAPNANAAQERMRIDENGNVGIGTTSPSQKLHVNGAVLFDGFAGGSTVGLNVGGTGNGQIRARHLEGKQSNTSSLGDLLMNYYSSGNIIIGIGGGNVGIGTANPAYKLHVVDGSDSFKFSSDIGSGFDGIKLEGGAPGVNFTGPGDDFVVGKITAGLSFFNNTVQSYKMVLTDAGNLGIGHSFLNPTVKLQVKAGNENLVAQFESDDSIAEIRIKDNTAYSRLLNVGTQLKLMPNDGVEMLVIDGNANTINVPDDKSLTFGANNDLVIQHNSGASLNQIDNINGDLYIQQNANDKDIIFRSDDGSGGLATYMTIDGGVEMTTFSKDTRHNDNVRLNMGDQNDLHLRHNGTNGFITNSTGNLYITNESDNEDIIFRCDDGAGGVATYFYLDGSLTTVTPRTVFPDDSVLGFGTGADLQIYHDGTTSNIANYTNNLSIINHFNDGDIKFFSDDGSGGITEYFRVDGGDEIVLFSKPIVTNQYVRLNDNVQLRIGTGSDLRLSHDGFDSYIQNVNGSDLYIQNTVDNKDIIFRSDNGSGGVTEYFKLQGSNERLVVAAPNGMKFNDSIQAKFGNGSDLAILHNGSHSFITNATGDLTIANYDDDRSIYFQSDDGGGGSTNYIQIDGANVRTLFSVNAEFSDNVKAKFGNSDDLEIYHSGSHSIIQDNGTGDLLLRGNNLRLQNSDGLQTFLHGYNNSGVEIYYNAVKKFETTSTGTKTTGQMDLAALNTPVTNSDDNGTPGEIRFTADYIYVCVADDTWKRVALSTW